VEDRGRGGGIPLTVGTEKGLRLARWRAEIRTHWLQNKNVETQRYESPHKG